LAVSRYSAHPQETVKLVRFLIHAQVESIETGSDASGSQGKFYNLAPVSSRFVKMIHKGSMVYRPSIETGSQYTQVSGAYARAVHAVLAGQKEAREAAGELEKQLVQITGFRPGLPIRGK
jgi:hypothetical protein